MAVFFRSFPVAAFIAICLFSLPAFAENPPLFTKKYSRTVGKPDVYSDSFKSCNTGATYKMVVQNNGTLGLGRISSGSITLNGSEVIKESDFNQKVEKIERNVTLAEANTLDVKLASGPGGTLNVSIFCSANCLEVKITEPQTGASRISTFLLKGELYNAQGMMDIKVDNGHGRKKRVYKSGRQFGGMMSMPANSNLSGYVSEAVFTATATDACGYKAVDSVTVRYMDDPTNSQPGEMPVNPEFAVISKKTGVARVEVGNPDYKNSPYHYEWDFEGDGVVDTSGTGLLGFYHEYKQPGFYTPISKEFLSDGAVSIGVGAVAVITEDELDAEIKPVWNGLKAALARGDINGALEFVEPRSREKYRKLYEIMKSNGTLSLAASEMGEPRLDWAADYTATYLVTRKQMFKGAEKEITFEIRFSQDNDTGLWRIERY
ncbi:MAG: hypothetical protein OEV59_01330 [Deltaproteobacteria bacterium]|nr:hypothetical protein [Deltaproteobacteria bacterium]